MYPPLFQRAPRQGRTEQAPGIPLSWELNECCTAANGGYGKLCEIYSLVWLVRSTEFSILLLRQCQRLRNAHSVLVENYSTQILTRFTYKVWCDPLPLPPCCHADSYTISRADTFQSDNTRVGLQIFFITVTRFWLVKFCGFARSLVRTELIRTCINPFWSRTTMPQEQSDDGSLSPDKEDEARLSSIDTRSRYESYQRNGSAMWELGAVSPIVNDRYYLGMGNTIGLSFRLLCLLF
jgi:hypothetical protein